MDTQIIKSFYVIGLAVRTTNENGQAAKDIPALWSRFYGEGWTAKISGKKDETVYCLYTDYELDHTKPYTTVLGYKVDTLDDVPDGLTGLKVETATYQKFTAKGNLMQGAVYNEWLNIWQAPINRSFTTDFEVYDQKSGNPEAAEVDIFIAVK